MIIWFSGSVKALHVWESCNPNTKENKKENRTHKNVMITKEKYVHVNFIKYPYQVTKQNLKASYQEHISFST